MKDSIYRSSLDNFKQYLAHFDQFVTISVYLKHDLDETLDVLPA